jgi:ribosomal protein S27E
MILECGKCAKMYRVRDDASTQPTQCPTCGGTLSAAGGGSAPNAASRVKELETRIQNLEKELEETRRTRGRGGR